MCTLTFIPKSDTEFILTSNRDEAPNRSTSHPKVYHEGGVRLLYPKDDLAGGSWIGVSDKERIISLLNGGFMAHERQSEYRMSRGIILKDLLVAEDVFKTIDNYNFMGIEPFTIVMVNWANRSQIHQLVWDGEAVHFEEKPWAPQIWSSALLYSEEMRKMREVWFAEFLFEKIAPTEEELLYFHKNAGSGDTNTDLIMDRGFVKTKSITQISLSDNLHMRYEDLQTEKISRKDF